MKVMISSGDISCYCFQSVTLTFLVFAVKLNKQKKLARFVSVAESGATILWLKIKFSANMFWAFEPMLKI